MLKTLVRMGAITALVLPTLPAAVLGQSADPQAVLADKSFVAPTSDIADMVLAPRYLNVALTNVSPNKRWFVNEVGDGPVTMDRFSKDFDELGGVFIDYKANRHRNLTIRTNVGLTVISAVDGSVTEVDVPDGARVSNATWSPDGNRLAFYVHTDEETHIHVADPSDGDSRRVTSRPVLATMVTGFEWTSDGQEIATVLVPDDRSARPLPSRIPTGPQVKQTEEGENMLRTYASLMATPYDEELLEWHATGQLAVIDVDSRDVTEIGAPSMITTFDFSPTGQHARVETMKKPFSYVVPVRSFGHVEEVWDRNGTALVQLADEDTQTGLDGNLPTAPGVGGESDEPDRRNRAWRADGAGLTFLQEAAAPEDEDEAADDDESRPADRVMLWAPPFDDASASVVYETESRMSAHRFNAAHSMLFVTERPRNGGGSNAPGGTVTEYAVDLSTPETTFTIVEYESDDFYDNPGSLINEGGRVPANNRFGGGGGEAQVVETSADGAAVFLFGSEYNEDPMLESPKNFIDRVDIRSGDKTRVFEADNDGEYNRVVSVLDADAASFVVARESPTEIA
ncbi:MAG: hypothetical protein L7S64_13280, partial [Longimicrobiales bacterium]|nr:hypothetical protein [Longimicrobiales bacterium]